MARHVHNEKPDQPGNYSKAETLLCTFLPNNMKKYTYIDTTCIESWIFYLVGEIFDHLFFSLFHASNGFSPALLFHPPK